MVLFLRVGKIIRGADSQNILTRDDEGREAEGKAVEATSNGCLSRRDKAFAEPVVVALALF